MRIMRKSKRRMNLVAWGWGAAMALITGSLVLRPEQTASARWLLGGMVALMWVFFAFSLAGMTSISRLRALEARANWWMGLALMIMLQVAMLQLLINMLRERILLGAAIVAFFLSAVFRFMRDVIRARQRAAARAQREDAGPAAPKNSG